MNLTSRSASVGTATPSAPTTRHGRRRVRGALTAVLLGGGLAMSATVIASATIPSADGTITACRAAVTGALRVIDADAGERCQDRLETPLTWNQQGPPGPPAVAPQLATRAPSRSLTLQPGQTASLPSPCALDEQITGGGYNVLELDTVARQVNVMTSFPLVALSAGQPDQWTVRAQNNATVPVRLITFAVCAR